MPHTTTKTSRTKRADTRPNEKIRRKLKRQIEDEKTIQDIRVTKKSKAERKEREVQRTPLADLNPASKEEKVCYCMFVLWLLMVYVAADHTRTSQEIEKN